MFDYLSLVKYENLQTIDLIFIVLFCINGYDFQNHHVIEFLFKLDSIF